MMVYLRRIILPVIVIFIAEAIVTSGAARKTRWRRSLPQLNQMIQTTTGMNGLNFNGYGNWCGFGGSGEPVDEIDRCCKVHDGCYDAIYDTVCQSRKGEIIITYTTVYDWAMKDGQLHCNDVDPCHLALCECDTNAAMCFAVHKASFDDKKISNLGKLIDTLLV